MAEPISADTRRRINQHIANLGSLEENVAQQAESRLLRFGKKAVAQLIETVSSDNPQVRFRAVYLLGKSGDPDALPVILRFISDPDDAVRYDAAMALGYLGNQLNWQEVKTEFEWDGSLCDLYLFDTDVEIWQRMLDVLRASGYPLHYTVDGELIEMPANVGVIFNKRLEENPMLSIEVQGININCHFVTQEQIEFDIDPREINTQAQFGHLCVFMRLLGNSLGRSVMLTPETSGYEQRNVIIRYSLTGDRFI